MLRSSHTILETSDICSREICVLKGKHIGFSTEQKLRHSTATVKHLFFAAS